MLYRRTAVPFRNTGPDRILALRLVTATLAVVVGICLVPCSGAAITPSVSPLTSGSDSRLAARVRLRSPAVPLGRVIPRLARATGVRLEVEPPNESERLVAFVPDSPLAEVMGCIAELYRLEWARRGEGERTIYRLRKPAAALREEAGLRKTCLNEVREILEQERRSLAALDGLQTPAAMLTAACELEPWQWSALVGERSLYLPFTQMSSRQRQRMIRLLARDITTVRETASQYWADRSPYLKTDPAVIGAEEACSLSLKIRSMGGLDLTINLDGWSAVTGASLDRSERIRALQIAGIDLYRNRPIRLPGPPAKHPLDASEASDAFTRSCRLGPRYPEESSSGVVNLRRLSDGSSIPIYCDYYASEEFPQHLPWSFEDPVRPLTALDHFGYGAHNSRPRSSFWWRRNGAALIRSSTWLWEEETVLPLRLLDRLRTMPAANGRPHPDILPVLASLTAPQLDGVLRHQALYLDMWRNCVINPARLSLTAQRRLMEGGLTWDALGAQDRALTANLLGGADPTRFEVGFSAFRQGEDGRWPDIAIGMSTYLASGALRRGEIHLNLVPSAPDGLEATRIHRSVVPEVTLE